MIISNEPTPEMVAAYGKAWNATPQGQPGDRTRAGLRAALEVQELLGRTIGQHAYDAFGAKLVMLNGSPGQWIPWDEQTPFVQAAWEAAAERTAEVAQKIKEMDR